MARHTEKYNEARKARRRAVVKVKLGMTRDEYYILRKEGAKERRKLAARKSRAKRRAEDPVGYKAARLKESRRDSQKFPYFFYKYKRGARVRGHEFSLSREEFLSFWQKPCHYCGEVIKTIGVDRVDNSMGYIPSNCVSCCKYCNSGKNTQTVKEFIDRCKRVTKLH